MSWPRTQQFIPGLRSKNNETKMRTARELSHFVKTELREMSPEELSSFIEEFNRGIFAMVSSNDVNEKKGGILAIICMIGADVGNINNRIGRFALLLRNLFPSNDVSVMELAAKTMGKITLSSGSWAAGYVDFEVKRAFEWLSGDRQEGKRHAAVLILKELAIAVPTYFFQQVQQFFDHLFVFMRDPKAAIRETGAEALRAALVVTAQRETVKQSQKPLWYKHCYEEANIGLDDTIIREKGINKEDHIHGSLLVLNELFRVSNIQWERYYEELMQKLEFNQNCNGEDVLNSLPQMKSPFSFKNHKSSQSSIGNNFSFRVSCGGNQLGLPEATLLHESSVCRALLMEHFDQVCNSILTQRISRNAYIQQILPKVLPRLAAFNKEKFIKNHLNASMVYLLSTLRGKDRDRASAFITIGLIAVAVEEHIKSHLPKIMEFIRASLPTKVMSNFF